MSVRSLRERLLQTLAFEAVGLMLAAPLYLALAGTTAAGSVALLAAISAAVMAWSPLHNTLFDAVEWRLTGRVASARPHGLRALHAVSHEASSVVVTLPVIMAVGGHDLGAALAVDLGLTLFYAAYAYVFHLVYDRLRPVGCA